MKIESKLFWSVKEVLIFGVPVMIVVGNRSTGKSFSTKDYCWKHSIEDGNKLETIYIRRYEDDIDFILSRGERQKLTGDLEEKLQYWRDHKLEVRGRSLYHKGSPICEFLSIEAAERIKSAAYAHVKYIIFEEFISDKNKYKKGEVKNFLSLIFSLIRERDDIQIFMLSNSQTIANPYFKALGITKLAKGETYHDEVVAIQYLYKPELNKALAQTTAAKIIQRFDPEYAAQALDNEFIGDNMNGVYTLSESAHKIIKYNLQLTTMKVGVWEVNGLTYIGKFNNGSTTYCYRVSDAADNKGIFLGRKHIIFQRLYKAYRDGTLGYADINIKNEVFELLQNTVPNFS